MNIQLVAATENDKSEIWSMFVPAMKPYVEKIWGWEFDWQTHEFNSRYFELNTSFLFNEGTKIGYVQYSKNTENTYLNMLILKPEYQGAGIGTQVLDLIQGLQADKPLKLRCFHINEGALRFYQRLGFAVIEKEEHFSLLERPAYATHS